MIKRCMQEDLDGLQAREGLDCQGWLARTDVVVSVDVQVMATLGEAAGAIPAQARLIIAGPGVDGGRAERGSTNAYQPEEPGTDALVLAVRVNTDCVDRGEGSVNRQIKVSLPPRRPLRRLAPRLRPGTSWRS